MSEQSLIVRLAGRRTHTGLGTDRSDSPVGAEGEKSTGAPERGTRR
ncbi:hypothetical protein [Halolamina litorea]|uniref:Uncharacterized protein n=1 Tax=Halolamina litorea TaxID=1515593 RepID=A0ABD6BS87_9EURY|nr:hypothetical protein [Halolamina litorea]